MQIYLNPVSCSAFSLLYSLEVFYLCLYFYAYLSLLTRYIFFFLQVTEYVYEEEMEEAYRASLFKSFTKTLEDGFFPVVIVDAIHDKVRLDLFSVDCLSCLEICHYAVRSTVKNEVSDIKAICTNMSLF